MKKQIIYLVLLSLMACKKRDCPVETVDVEPKKPPLVDCSRTTTNRDTAQTLIVGKWQLERTVFADRRLGKTVYKYANELPRIILDFRKEGSFDYFQNDTLRAASTYGFYKLSEITKFQADSTRNALHMPQMLSRGVSFGTLITYRICDDSLFLPFQSFAFDAVEDQIFKKIK